jgi:type IX secretion system PorP/SprF family membrane protein
MSGKAQDPNFSQFFASPLTLNPAFTGKFEGKYRVAANYRDQWPAFKNVFVTNTASIDFQILRSKIPEIDRFGIGIMGLMDRTASGALRTNSGSLSLAYHKGLDEDGYHQIGVGFMATYTSRNLDVSKVKFEDQLDSRSGQFILPSLDVFNGATINASYFDLQAGILYNGSSNDKNNFYLGVSMYHINRPKESFKPGGFYILSSRVTFQGGIAIPVGEKAMLHTSAMHSVQAKATNTVLGAAVSKMANDDETNPTNIYAGAWFRFGDALIPYVGLEFNNLRIGASYDVNISSLSTASQRRGGFELSLIYINRPPDAKGINCPRF